MPSQILAIKGQSTNLATHSTWLHRLLDWFFGYDYFIAHRSVDGKAYALALYNTLTSGGKKLDCFLDVRHYHIGGNLPSMQTRALAKTTRLIVIVTPHAHDNEAVYLRNEITEFKRRHPAGLIVPVGTRKSLSQQDNPTSELLTLLGGTTDNICAYDSDSALEKGVPSSAIGEKLLNDFRELRKASRRIRWIAGIMILLLLLLGLTITFWRDSEVQQRALVIQTSRAQIERGTELISEGKGAEAVARFARAFELTPDDYSVRVALWMAIAERTWILPVGDTITPNSSVKHHSRDAQIKRTLPIRSAQPYQTLRHSSQKKRLVLTLEESESRKLVIEDSLRDRSQEVLFDKEIEDADSTSNGDCICVVLRGGELLRLQWVNSAWEKHLDGNLHDSIGQSSDKNGHVTSDGKRVNEDGSAFIAISPNDLVCRVIFSGHGSEFVFSKILVWAIQDGRRSMVNQALTESGQSPSNVLDDRQNTLVGNLHSTGWSHDGRYEMLALETSSQYSTGIESEVSVVVADTDSLSYRNIGLSFRADEGYSMAVNQDAGFYLWVANRGGAWKCDKPFVSDFDLQSPNLTDLVSPVELSTQLKTYVESTFLITDFATKEVLPCIYFEGGSILNPWTQGIQEARWGTRWKDRMSCSFIKSSALDNPAPGASLNDLFFRVEDDLEDAKVTSENGQVTLSSFIAGRSREVKVTSEDGSAIQARASEIFISDRDVLGGLGFGDTSGDVFWLIIGDKKVNGDARITFFDRKSGKQISGTFNSMPRLPSSRAVLSKDQVFAIVAMAHQIAGCRVNETGSIVPVKVLPQGDCVMPEDWTLLFSKFVKDLGWQISD